MAAIKGKKVQTKPTRAVPLTQKQKAYIKQTAEKRKKIREKAMKKGLRG